MVWGKGYYKIGRWLTGYLLLNSAPEDVDEAQEQARTRRDRYNPNPWLEHNRWERHLHSDCRQWITEFIKAVPNASKVQEFSGEDEE